MAAPIEFTVPVRTVSLTNQREHWRARATRAKAERAMVGVCWQAATANREKPMVGKDQTVRVNMTRVAPRRLDSDNLASSQKHTRDGIAACLGIDDGDKRVTWIYDQVTGRPGEYAVRVVVRIG